MDSGRPVLITNSVSGKAARMAKVETTRRANKRRRNDSSSSDSSTSSSHSSDSSGNSSSSSQSSKSDNSPASSTDSSESESFNQERLDWKNEKSPASYSEWRAYIVKTYLEGIEPVRKVYPVSRSVKFVQCKDGKLVTAPPPSAIEKDDVHQKSANLSENENISNSKEVNQRLKPSVNQSNQPSGQLKPLNGQKREPNVFQSRKLSVTNCISTLPAGFKNFTKIFRASDPINAELRDQSCVSKKVNHHSSSTPSPTPSTLTSSEKRSEATKNESNCVYTNNSSKKPFVANAKTNSQVSNHSSNSECLIVNKADDERVKLLKAKILKEASQPAKIKPKVNPRQDYRKQFKIPNQDAAGNPIRNQSTSNFNSSNSATTIITTSASTNPPLIELTTGQSTSATSSNVTSPESQYTCNTGPNASMPYLKVKADTFWSLNSAAKLIHVKTQLDEPSQVYVEKLMKNFAALQREIYKLKKDKLELINVIKKVEKAVTNDAVRVQVHPEDVNRNHQLPQQIQHQLQPPQQIQTLKPVHSQLVQQQQQQQPHQHHQHHHQQQQFRQHSGIRRPFMPRSR